MTSPGNQLIPEIAVAMLLLLQVPQHALHVGQGHTIRVQVMFVQRTGAGPDHRIWSQVVPAPQHIAACAGRTSCFQCGLGSFSAQEGDPVVHTH